MSNPKVRGSLKLICKTADCINKSVVYRRAGSDPNSFYCKKCNQPLSRFVPPSAQKQNDKAKSDLKEFGL